MRAAILIPVFGILSGASIGFAVADAGYAFPSILTIFIVTAVIALTVRDDRVWLFALALFLSFASGSALLAVRAWREAWRPSLRVAFDEAIGPEDAVFATVSGVLRSDASVSDDSVSLNLDTHTLEIRGRGSGRAEEPIAGRGEQSVHGGALISLGGVLAPPLVERWRAGRLIRLPVRLHRPSRHLDPGVPDEERALARRGVILVGSAKSGALVEVLAHGSLWTETAAAIRAFTRRVVATHVGQRNPVSAAIVTAILIGDRAGLTPEVEQALQQAGTYHVIAISGGNIAILATLTLTMFRWAGVLGRGAMLTAIAGFLVYGAIVEGGASVTRALVTANLCFLARAIDHRVDPLHGLAIAAGLLVAADPLAIADAGFLLSFGATAGIVMLAPVMRGRDWSRAIAAAASMLLASTAAEVALLPMSAYIFGRVTLAGLALNFAAIPAMAVTQVAGMLLVPLALVSNAAAGLAGRVASFGASVLVESASIGWVSMVSWQVARPSTLAVVVYYAAALAAWCGWFIWRRAGWRVAPRARALVRVALALTCASAVWIVLQPWTLLSSRGDGRLHVTFVDVGQGDAAFVRFPRGGAMLVDAGGTASSRYDVGARVVGPVLREAGVRRLDTFVLTHGDIDHVGGAASVLRDFRPVDVWEGVPVPRMPLLNVLRWLAAAQRTRWTTVQRDDRTEIEGVQVRVHHPALPDWERQDPRNDDSVVIELRWRDVSVVLAGDIEREAEQAIAGRFEPAALRVLKVPHHGSLTSSSEPFVGRLRPQVAIVSAGKGNPFGHPAPVVLERYWALGTALFRTDQDGAITVETDGATLEVSTYTGRRLLMGHKDTKTQRPVGKLALSAVP